MTLAERARLPARSLPRREKLYMAATGGAIWALAMMRLHRRAGHLPLRLVPRKPMGWGGVLRETYSDFSRNDMSRRGAALAYYTVFSLSPLVLILMAVVGLVFGDEAARGLVESQLNGVLGAQGASAVQSMVAGAQRPQAGTVAGIIGVLALLFGAQRVVGELQTSLNQIWGIAGKTGGLLYQLRSRIVSMSFVLVLGFLLLVSLVLSSAVAAAAKYVDTLLPLPGYAIQALNQGVFLGIVTVLFALMFRYLPAARLPWRVVMVGGFATSILFLVGNALVSLYIGKGGPTSGYGAAGSILAVMVWAYYTSQVVYLGAEFTEAYAFRRGVALSRRAEA